MVISFKIFEKTYIQPKEELIDRVVYFAMCYRITRTTIEDLHILKHEEADTKVVSLVCHATEQIAHGDTKVIVRSSHNMDIPVIMLGSNLEWNIVIDSDRSNHQKFLNLN